MVFCVTARKLRSCSLNAFNSSLFTSIILSGKSDEFTVRVSLYVCSPLCRVLGHLHEWALNYSYYSLQHCNLHVNSLIAEKKSPSVKYIQT